MTLVVVSKSPDAVISLDQVKRWLRIDNPDEDDRVQFLLSVAADYVEQVSRMVFSETVFQLVLDAFPAVNWYQYYPVMAPFPQLLTLGQNFFLPNQTINQPVYPVTSIDSIQYVDADSGQVTTLDPSLYTVDLAGTRIAPAAQQIWPAAKNQLDSVTIQFHAGFGPGNVPTPLKLAVLNHCLLAYMNPGGIPAADLENLDKAIIAQRQNLLV
ncbi:MAG: phage head-tail connector protein [Thermoguttaceae bacterium]|jgi:hypothetical protein